jgi:hypothetical protein
MNINHLLIEEPVLNIISSSILDTIGIPLVLLTVALWLGIPFYLDKRRGIKLIQIAKEINLSVSSDGKDAEGVDIIPDELNFGIFTNAGFEENVIYGKVKSAKVAIFDYLYTRGGGDATTAKEQTIIYFECSILRMPAFSLRPESMRDKITMALTNKQDFNFANHPNFSKKYLLSGEDEAQIKKFFNANLLGFFENVNPQFCIDAMNNHLVIYNDDTRVKPMKIKSFMNEGIAILEAFVSSSANTVARRVKN